MAEATIGDLLKHGRTDGPHTSEVNHKKKRNNCERAVDRLPSEILSHIFLTSEALARKTRARTVSYNTVQEVASQICRYWRGVAINTPALWAYIHISRPLPNPLASLYLGRSGSTQLLDIDLEMRSRYWRKAQVRVTEWDKQFTLLVELLDYLLSHGADFRRWKALSVCSKRIEPLFVLILRLNLESAPSLERITFKNHVSENAPTMTLAHPYSIDINHSPAWENSDANVLSNYYCISGTALPKLRCVDFGFVPCEFLFGRPSPLLTGLTRLSLEINWDSVWLTLSMRPFFSANSQFEKLSLCSKAHTSSNCDMFAKSKDPPIELSQLRSLSINATGPRHLNWVLLVFQMIDTPALESFTLELDNSRNYNHELLAYIATGSTPAQRSHNWHSNIESVPTRIGPIYPALHSLDISKVEASYAALESMLLPLSTVAYLSIGHYDDHLRVLNSSRNMLPNLVALQITDKCNTLAVARCLYRRWELGVPVKDLIPRFTGHQ